MKSICLVTALTVSDFIDPDLTAGANSNTGAQLGVLTLAALIRRQGYDPHIVNLDDLLFARPDVFDAEDPLPFVLEVQHRLDEARRARDGGASPAAAARMFTK